MLSRNADTIQPQMPYLIEVPSRQEIPPRRRILEQGYSVRVDHTIEPVDARDISKIHFLQTSCVVFVPLFSDNNLKI